MATLPTLESGRMQAINVPGAVTPNVQAPEVNYVGMRRAITANQEMAQTLDRLSSSLFQTAGTYAQEKATRFAAENPLTNVQLQAAVNGDFASFDQGGGGGEIYQRALEKARAFQMSSAFEVEARDQLTKMLVALESGDESVTTQNFQSAITSLSAGFGKAVAAQSPEAAMKLRASIATTGNVVLQKAAEFELKRDKERREIALRTDFSNTERILEATISQGFWVDDKGTKRSIEDLIDVERKSMAIKAFSLGNGQLAKEYGDRFEQAVRKAKINAITGFIVNDNAMMADPDMALQRLRSGDLGKMSDVAKILGATDFDAIKTISANIMTEANNRYTLKQRKVEAEKNQDIQTFVGLYTQAIGMAATDPGREALVLQINDIAKRNPSAIPLNVIKDLNEPDKEGNYMVEFNALEKIYSGEITSADQLRNVSGLTGKQYVSLLGKLMSQEKSNDAKLNRGLTLLAGIPVMPGQVIAIDPKGDQFKRLRDLKDRAESIKNQANREGKYISSEEILSQLEKEIAAKRNSEAVKRAKERLDFYQKKEWINGVINEDTLPGLKRKAKDNKSRMNDIAEIERQLKIINGGV